MLQNAAFSCARIIAQLAFKTGRHIVHLKTGYCANGVKIGLSVLYKQILNLPK
jgi:hypothetical protein